MRSLPTTKLFPFNFSLSPLNFQLSTKIAFILFFILASFSINAQPHSFGCQHWKKVGGKQPQINAKAQRELNESILRSDTFDILHYDIAIDITDYSGQTIKAETKIRFTPKLDAQDFIRFDLVRLTVDSVKMNNQTTNFQTDSSHIKIDFPQAMMLGDTNEVSVYYQGNPYQDPVWGGFYFASGYIYNLGIGLTTIPPNFGKVWYPCFDSFAERATYTYRVKSAGTFRAYCQGDFIDEQVVGGDTVIRTYSFNQPLPTHLSAIAASNYREIAYNHAGQYGLVPVKLRAKPADTTLMRSKFSSLGSAIDACEYWYGATGWPGVGYSITTVGALEITGNIAYPISMLSQSDADNRNLYAHELGHYWWGNWIAPYNHNDMWLKEGPAEYSGHLTAEVDEGYNAFIKEVKDNHQFVLKSAHINDGDYYALSPMPDDVIYGDHTYYKGASVMHNLRGYLGDALFKQAMSGVQQNHPYETITPDQFRDYLTQESGFDLTNFFNDQVYKPGFSVFVVDSFQTQQSGNNYNVDVFMQQKLRKCPSFYGEVPLDLTLIGANRQRADFRVIASGQYSQTQVTANFQPVMVIINGYSKLNQARTDFESTYGSGQTIVNGILPYSDFRLYLDSIPDSTFIRVEHIWAAPDSTFRNDGIYQFPKNHYWHVDGVFADGAKLRAQVNYIGNTSESLDYDLFNGDETNAVLIYRESAKFPWRVYSDYTLVTGSLTNGIGYIKIDTLKKGDYAFAKGDADVSLTQLNSVVKKIKIFPNPTNDLLNVYIPKMGNEFVHISIYSEMGQLIQNHQVKQNENGMLTIDVKTLTKGNYIITANSLQNKVVYSEKFQVY